LKTLTKKYDINLRCYEFSKSVVLFINKNEFRRIHYPIVDQLLRSATSIGANVIEARSGNSRKNLISFFSIALRSANETKYWLCLIRDTLEVDKTEANDLIREADEISKILARSLLTLKEKQTVE
jgi:four helix bundle protein